MRIALIATTLLVLTSGWLQAPAHAQEYTVGAKYIDARLTYAPPPQIPGDLKAQHPSSYCVARFVIDPSGRASVRLLCGSGVGPVDDIIYSTLRGWRFYPATLDGRPVEAVRTMRVSI